MICEMSLDRARLVSSREFESHHACKDGGNRAMGLERCMFSFDVERLRFLGCGGDIKKSTGKTGPGVAQATYS